MKPPWQMPAWSPLDLAGVLAGVTGAVKGGAAPRTALAERLVAELGVSGAVLLDSGTNALAEGLSAASPEGDRAVVALPAWCCYDVATAADAAGVRVRLYDVDPRTLGPDMDSLRTALGEGATVVVAVHLYGYPVDMEAVLAVAGEEGAVVVEDAAQGIGAAYRGRALGSIGAYGVLSFGRGKGLTGGGGGALLANRPEAAARLEPLSRTLDSPPRGWRDVMALAALWALGRPVAYAVPASLPFLRLGETIYHEAWSTRAQSAASMSAVAALWSAATREADRRRARAAELTPLLAGTGGLTAIEPVEGALPGALRLPVIVPEGEVGRFRSEEARRLGIMPGYPRTLVTLEGFRDRCLDPDRRTPGAALLAARLFTVPTHSRTTTRGRRLLEAFLTSG